MNLKSIENRIFQILVSFDRMVNAFIGGDAGETLSSVAYRKHRDKKAFGFMQFLIEMLFGKEHCYNAYLHDRSPKLQE